MLEIVKTTTNAFLFCALTSFWTAIAHGVRNSTKSPTPCLHGWPEDGPCDGFDQQSARRDGGSGCRPGDPRASSDGESCTPFAPAVASRARERSSSRVF